MPDCFAYMEDFIDDSEEDSFSKDDESYSPSSCSEEVSILSEEMSSSSESSDQDSEDEDSIVSISSDEESDDHDDSVSEATSLPTNSSTTEAIPSIHSEITSNLAISVTLEEELNTSENEDIASASNFSLLTQPISSSTEAVLQVQEDPSISKAFNDNFLNGRKLTNIGILSSRIASSLEILEEDKMLATASDLRKAFFFSSTNEKVGVPVLYLKRMRDDAIQSKVKRIRSDLHFLSKII